MKSNAHLQNNVKLFNLDMNTLPWCLELFFPIPGCICLLFQLEEVKVLQSSRCRHQVSI